MGRYFALWAVLAAVLLGESACGHPRVGTQEVWTADCGHSASLSLQLAYVPGSFETGDRIGWGLGYRDSPGSLLWLYNNGIHPPGVWGYAASKYVGWSLDGAHKEVGPTYAYTPMPAAVRGHVVLFDPAAGLGPPESGPGIDPPLMNIFIDPSVVSPQKFSAVVSCLSARRNELNAAMARLPEAIPADDAELMHVLRLGGIAYELPPYGDPAFMDAVANMRSARTIPQYGPFILYPGRTATGRIAGHAVRLTVSGKQEPGTRLEVDGVVVKPTSNLGPTNVAGVSGGSMRWTIDGPVCDQKGWDCGADIETMDPHQNDGSESLDVEVRTDTYTYSQYPDWSAESRAARKAAGNCDIAPGC